MPPLFSFGLPTAPSMAVLLGGLMMYGIQPGPMLFVQNPQFVRMDRTINGKAFVYGANIDALSPGRGLFFVLQGAGAYAM
ncbi:MAG: hypothetical protein FJ122_12180 [Deltaproteobacteria bacterium]|nr:hypothetical protein [Deltaproteobacteria bacterium]